MLLLDVTRCVDTNAPRGRGVGGEGAECCSQSKQATRGLWHGKRGTSKQFALSLVRCRGLMLYRYSGNSGSSSSPSLTLRAREDHECPSYIYRLKSSLPR